MHLGKLFLSISIFFLFVSCGSEKKLANKKTEKRQFKQTVEQERYVNARYDIALIFPQEWIILEEQNITGAQYAINIFNKKTSAESNIPLDVHEPANFSYITIWPEGLATELPFSRYGNFKNELNLNFNVDWDNSKQLMLKDETAWAYFIVPKNPPENWSDYGFIYAQFKVQNGNVICVDGQTGEQKPMERCDLMGGGDKVIRSGQVDERTAAIVRHILESIQFKKVDQKIWAGDYIKVKQPLPNTTITSPLTVTGKARGSWYFEGIFPVKLVDASGDLLAKSIAKAQESWTTSEFVPFKTTLNFDQVPEDERGQLLLIKANPSGLAKHADTLSVPVIF